MKKTGKNTELCQKKLIFGQTYMKLVVAMEISAPQSKSSFPNFENTLLGGMASTTTPSLVRPRVKGYCKEVCIH